MKGAVAPWGSVLFHAGLVLLFIGALVSAGTRFTGYVELAPGQVLIDPAQYVQKGGGALLPDAPDLDVGIRDIDVAFWPDGSVQDIAASVVMMGRSGRVHEGPVGRNRALTTDWTSVILGSPIGPAVLLRFTPTGSDSGSQGYVNLSSETLGTKSDFAVPGTGTRLDIMVNKDWRAAVASGPGAAIPTARLTITGPDSKSDTRIVAQGESMPIEGGALEFVRLDVWGLFMVSRDYGMPVMIGGGVIALIGLAIALFIAPRWVRIEEREGIPVLSGRMPHAGPDFERELQSIAVDLEKGQGNA